MFKFSFLNLLIVLSLLFVADAATQFSLAGSKTRLKRGEVFKERATTYINLKRQVSQKPLLSDSIKVLFPKITNQNSKITELFPTKEIMRFNGRDIALLIDKSRSMIEADAPGNLSRWDWVHGQVGTLSYNLDRLPDSRLNVVLFDNDYINYPMVKFRSLNTIFDDNRPSGGTNVSKAINSVLQSRSVNKRPLLVVVITDGAPSSSRRLKDLLISHSHKYSNKENLKVTFLQIGNESQGNRLLPSLDHNLINQGAKYDLVDSVSFDSLKRTGLISALARVVGKS